MTPRTKAKQHDAVTIDDGSAQSVDVRNPTDNPITVSIGDGNYTLEPGDSRTFATGGHPVTASAELQIYGAPHSDPLRIFTKTADGYDSDYPASTISVDTDTAARARRDQMTGDGVQPPITQG
jgi:hypothetical protein